ncbi:MAG: hypothetical protein AABZ39_05705 [Spirochaetota bacterium]
MKRIIILTVTISVFFTGCIEFVDNSKRSNPWDPLGAFAWTTVASGATPQAGSMLAAQCVGGDVYVAFKEASGDTVCGKINTLGWTKTGGSILIWPTESIGIALAINTTSSRPVVLYSVNPLLEGFVREYDGSSWQTSGNFAPCHNDKIRVAVSPVSNKKAYVTCRFTGVTLKVTRTNSQSDLGSPAIFAESTPTDIAIVAGTVTGDAYVAYTLPSAVGVQRCAGSGDNTGTWGALGASTNIAGAAAYISMAVDSAENIYVAYQDQSQGNKAVVRKFNGTSWSTLGTTASEGAAAWISIAVDKDNVPHLAFSDGTRDNKLTVVRYDNGIWAKYGYGISSSAATEIILLGSRTSTTFYVAFCDASAGGKITVLKK